MRKREKRKEIRAKAADFEKYLTFFDLEYRLSICYNTVKDQRKSKSKEQI